MGTFYTERTIENHVNRKKATHIPKILVDIGSEYTWVSENYLRTLEGLNLTVDSRQKKLVAVRSVASCVAI